MLKKFHFGDQLARTTTGLRFRARAPDSQDLGSLSPPLEPVVLQCTELPSQLISLWALGKLSQRERQGCFSPRRDRVASDALPSCV